MSTERELRQLYQDVHFFAAPLSETLISVWRKIRPESMRKSNEDLSNGIRPITCAYGTLRPVTGNEERPQSFNGLTVFLAISIYLVGSL